jgi:hypothetical protein
MSDLPLTQRPKPQQRNSNKRQLEIQPTVHVRKIDRQKIRTRIFPETWARYKNIGR